jgi:beta-N-acetylhexosaminidase
MMGKDLLSLGINMNLAPVLDVNNNPKNPIIGIRSYSDNPETVSKFGNLLIKGMQEEGLIATCKHFPGHGDVELDTHLGLPRLNFDKSRMDNIELKPFKDAINNGVKNIMTAHIIFKEIDNENPATLSEKILKGILRNQLKYNGIITSDCMEMKAISEGITTQIGAIRGLKAGLDLVCVSHSKERQINSINEIKKAVDDNYINIEEIDEKVQRILEYKRQLYEVMNLKFFNNKENLNTFNDDNNCKIIQNIVDSSFTYVDGKKFELKGKILLYGCKPYNSNVKEDLNKGDEENIIYLINKEIPSIHTIEYKKNVYSEDLINKSKDYDTVIFVSFNAFSNPLQAKMINELNKICQNFFVISIRNPYDYLKIEKKINCYTMYECTPNSIRTVVKFLKGEIEAIGKLPINLK